MFRVGCYIKKEMSDSVILLSDQQSSTGLAFFFKLQKVGVHATETLIKQSSVAFGISDHDINNCYAVSQYT